MDKAKKIARMLDNVAIRARKLGVNFMYILDAVDHHEFDTTGTANWSADAADVLTAWTEEKLHEELTIIDELLEKLEDDAIQS